MSLCYMFKLEDVTRRGQLGSGRHSQVASRGVGKEGHEPGLSQL
jgi:hypothetical protein